MELSKDVVSQTEIDLVQLLLERDPENAMSPSHTLEYFCKQFPPIALGEAIWRKHNMLVFMKKPDHSLGRATTRALMHGKYLSHISAEMVSSIGLHDLGILNYACIICPEVLQDVEKYIPQEQAPKEYSEFKDTFEQKTLVCSLIKRAIAQKHCNDIIHVDLPRQLGMARCWGRLQEKIDYAVVTQFKPAEDQVIRIELRTVDFSKSGLSSLLLKLIEKGVQNTVPEKEPSGTLYVNASRQFGKARFCRDVKEGVIPEIQARFTPEEDQVMHIEIRTTGSSLAQLSPQLEQMLKKKCS